MEQKQFIYLLRLVPSLHREENWTDEANAIVGRHFRYLKRHLEQGTLIMAGRTSPVDETTFGIVVFKAADMEAARAFMRQDPAVAEGVMTAELSPFHVALSAMTV
ncbi:YciI family protein [Paenibacillus silvisoli]|uniref:YciI family protein n=1 Tax=Paenibacillus silvisoli TaxID=3110539 RepID=UPI0028059C47|nr:YciI family protein [Paenibacillus silvisoli]